MPKMKIKVDSHWDGDSVVRARVGNHDLVVDKPPAMGGTDKGPNPLEYLLVAMSGCITSVGMGVAKNMGITFKKLAYTVEGDLTTEGLAGTDPVKYRPGFDAIRIIVHADSDAAPDQLQAWLEATEALCPVVETIHHGTRVETKFG